MTTYYCTVLLMKLYNPRLISGSLSVLMHDDNNQD